MAGRGAIKTGNKAAKAAAEGADAAAAAAKAAEAPPAKGKGTVRRSSRKAAPEDAGAAKQRIAESVLQQLGDAAYIHKASGGNVNIDGILRGASQVLGPDAVIEGMKTHGVDVSGTRDVWSQPAPAQAATPATPAPEPTDRGASANGPEPVTSADEALPAVDDARAVAEAEPVAAAPAPVAPEPPAAIDPQDYALLRGVGFTDDFLAKASPEEVAAAANRLRTPTAAPVAPVAPSAPAPSPVQGLVDADVQSAPQPPAPAATGGNPVAGLSDTAAPVPPPGGYPRPGDPVMVGHTLGDNPERLYTMIQDAMAAPGVTAVDARIPQAAPPATPKMEFPAGWRSQFDPSFTQLDTAEVAPAAPGPAVLNVGAGYPAGFGPSAPPPPPSLPPTPATTGGGWLRWLRGSGDGAPPPAAGGGQAPPPQPDHWLNSMYTGDRSTGLLLGGPTRASRLKRLSRLGTGPVGIVAGAWPAVGGWKAIAPAGQAVVNAYMGEPGPNNDIPANYYDDNAQEYERNYRPKLTRQPAMQTQPMVIPE